MKNMNQRFGIFVIGFVLGWLIGIVPSHARYKVEYDKLPFEIREWYRTRIINKEAFPRIKMEGSCCDNADVVDTQFKTEKDPKGYHDIWYYQDDDKNWVRIPEDIIHWDEHAPGGQPILYKWHDVETCFFPPNGAVDLSKDLNYFRKAF